MKVLIVEDNAEMRAVIRDMLARAGYEVCECADGAEALTAFERYQPDWTTMDLRMKGLGGLAATRQIKGRFPGARIVILTQFENAALRAAALRAGALDFFLKDNLAGVRDYFGNPQNE